MTIAETPTLDTAVRLLADMADMARQETTLTGRR